MYYCRIVYNSINKNCGLFFASLWIFFAEFIILPVADISGIKRKADKTFLQLHKKIIRLKNVGIRKRPKNEAIVLIVMEFCPLWGSLP